MRARSLYELNELHATRILSMFLFPFLAMLCFATTLRAQEQANEIVCSTATACKTGFVPLFSSTGGSAKLSDSNVSQSGSTISISGNETVTGNISDTGNITAGGNVSGSKGSFTGNLSSGGIVSGSGGSFSGDVGIGGTLQLLNSSATAGNILKGGTLFLHNFGFSNTFLGQNAGNLTMTGNNNVGTGANALKANTTGCCNTASGNNALLQNTTGGGNTASGDGALYSNSTGNNNTASGRFALISNTTGAFNTASGVSALQNNTGVNGIVGSASYNVATGYQALYSNTTGGYNTASGYQSLISNTEGYFNTASGPYALYSNTTGSSNTAIGSSALSNNTTGGGNTGVGWDANVSPGSNLSNATAIGFNAIVDASNKIRLGNVQVTVIEGQVAYTFTSDKRQKENFQPVEGEQVLRKIGGLTLTSWNYIGHDPKQFRHYGPVAQEFFGAFGHDAIGTIGTSTTINSGDMEGILMVAVQALEKRTVELAQEKERLTETVEALKAELEVQREDLVAISGRLKRLDRQELAAVGAAGQRPTPGGMPGIATMP
jgi:hypothetical protein